MGKILEIKNLVKLFPVKKGLFRKTVAHVHAVDDVSFYINESETFGLVGESGCGKTTVGKLIMQLHKADSGSIIYNGADLCSLPKKELSRRRSEVQIVFQDPYGSLNPRMKVADILSEGIRKHRLLPPDQIPARVAELLRLVGLHESDALKYPHEFSGGQRQRIAVARALSFNPKLVVCDEPVSALDVSVQAQILNLMVELQKKLGVSYLFIAHGMAVVKHISHRVGVMYLGKMVELAPTDELFDNYAHPYTQALLSSVPVANPRREKTGVVLEGEIPNPINPPSGCRFHPRCPYADEMCRCQEPVLTEWKPDHMVACHHPKAFEVEK
ncbi:MAG: ATP-binding cassette domain-containing protein [Oscillospiraceae bacterium]|nr:ATP-binding cassette domain-containing protein [Oscillospiraceae bacterium]